MINITNVKAKRAWVAEFDRQMQILENIFVREIRPVFNRQYFDAASLVRQGIFDINSTVDKSNPRLINRLFKHYKRVSRVFGTKAFKIIESSKSVDIPEIKTPKDEFFRTMNIWMTSKAGEQITKISTSTKKSINAIIQKGLNDGISHRDIAKNLRKKGLILNRSKAIMTARTETHTVAVKAVDESVRSTRIEMEREWVSSKDLRTRTMGKGSTFEHFLKFPFGPDGERVHQDGFFQKTGEPLKRPGDPRGSAANVINCLTNYATPIFTNNGWKRVKDIIVGDLVLTHKNRFKKVLRLNRNLYDGEVVTIAIEPQGHKITVTPEHPFLVINNNSKFSRWKKAKDISKNDTISFMAGYCEYCGKAIPYYLRYCDRICGGKAIIEKQWKDPKHRENISKKTSEQMQREYHTGTFSQIGMKVRSISSRKLQSNITTYNFAVENDESYIAKGFVNHNCRCVIIYHTVRRTENLKPHVPEEKPYEYTPFKGNKVNTEFQDNLNNSFGKLGKVSFPGRWNDKRKIEVGNVMGQEQDRLRNLYPGINKIFEGKKLKALDQKNKTGIKADLFNRQLLQNNALGQTGLVSKKIELATKGVNLLEETIQTGAYNIGNKRSKKFFIHDDMNLPTVYRHELGHIIHSYIKKDSKNYKVISDSYKKGLAIKAPRISEYAETNKWEYFAETFTLYTSPVVSSAQKQKIPVKLRDLFDKILQEQ